MYAKGSDQNVKLVFVTILSGLLLMVYSSFTADRVSSQPIAKRTVPKRNIKVKRGAGALPSYHQPPPILASSKITGRGPIN